MLSFDEIVVHLNKLCDERKSGTLFIKTNDNKSAQIALNKGKIVDCRCRHFRGAGAIQNISNIVAGTIAFNENMVISSIQEGLPKTKEILEQLANAHPQDSGQSAVQESVPTLTSAVTKNDTIIADVVSILTEYVGPLAAIICANHIPEGSDPLASSTGFARIIDNISEEIGSEAEGKEFKDRVMGLLEI